MREKLKKQNRTMKQVGAVVLVLAASAGGVLVGGLLFPLALFGATREVGPGKQYATPCQAMAAAAPGDVIEVDPAGSYDGDVCATSIPNLTVRGVGNQRPHLRAAGRASLGKGIWVLSPGAINFIVENMEFSGASAPDRNGAGIRVDPEGSLTVRNCYFHDNENGILAGDSSDGEFLIENSIFENNGFGDGQSHNLYINKVRRLVFRGNYSTSSRRGHLLKTRARENLILYNRLSQENGNGSYELDLPSGGRTFVIGNVIQQGPNSENPHLVAYRMEGSIDGHVAELHLVNNTFLNQNPGGDFILIPPDVAASVTLQNNIFFGPGRPVVEPGAVLENNFVGNPQMVDLAAGNYVPLANSPVVNMGVDPGSAGGMVLTPSAQYRHPACLEARVPSGALDMGAYEAGGAGAVLARPGSRCSRL